MAGGEWNAAMPEKDENGIIVVGRYGESIAFAGTTVPWTYYSGAGGCTKTRYGRMD